MAIVYLCEPGIKLWEVSGEIEAANFATLTLLGNSVDDITSLWWRFKNHVRAILPGVLKWRTIGYSLANSKAQESLVLKKISQSLGPADLVQKSLETGIISSIQDVSKKLNKIDFSELAQPTHSALIFIPPTRGDLRSFLINSLGRADEGLTIAEIRDFLQTYTDLVLCRAVESDTHFVVQFVGSCEIISSLSSDLKKQNVTSIQEKDVAAFINS